MHLSFLNTTEKNIIFSQSQLVPNRDKFFCFSPSKETSEKLKRALKHLNIKIQNALEWFNRIKSAPEEKARGRFWDFIELIGNP